MGADDSFRVGSAGERRMIALYEIIVNGAFELGETARIEIEIQKLIPSHSAQSRCPIWQTRESFPPTGSFKGHHSSGAIASAPGWGADARAGPLVRRPRVVGANGWNGRRRG